jgi:alkanesulfonate monooxygenase SsuD/methylene tetrahydromethanopterin reductase-like flavin-dependent oxidoreductase (luciferase family)
LSGKHIHLAVDAGSATDFDSLAQLARTAERGLLDFVLHTDLTALAALAGLTERIGLVGTIDTAATEPFEISRQLATLDHLSDGRAGWTIGPVAHDQRTAEFITVARAFWDSWAADAVLADIDTGIYADPNRIRPVDHTGPHFEAQGLATLPAGPSGHPVLLTAGAYGPVTLAGTPSQIADQIDHDVQSDVCDGVLLTADSLQHFVDQVVPLLQKRGVFRTEYRGTTLREHLGANT